jgi:hypothetical protein
MWGGNVLDELVEVAPGYYLGKSPLRALTYCGAMIPACCVAGAER